jgi:dTDP-4-amino-4,6-dideoxygalactose transaminase
MWGNVCNRTALGEIAARHGLRLLFDAAHAFGCGSHRDAPGGWETPEVFSFHATKVVHAFEGGAVVTDDDDLAQRLKFLVNFGFAGEDRVEHLGTNGKMSEASAAMGLSSLDALDDVLARNRSNLAAYARGLAAVPGVHLMPHAEGSGHNCHYIVIEVDRARAGLGRDELVAALRLENVFARRYFHPGCHRMQPYAGLFPRAGMTLPVTEAVGERVMVLPTGLSMDAARIGRLTDRIAGIVAQASAVRDALARCRDPRLPDFMRG